jgi:hypothetical protein
VKFANVLSLLNDITVRILIKILDMKRGAVGGRLELSSSHPYQIFIGKGINSVVMCGGVMGEKPQEPSHIPSC